MKTLWGMSVRVIKKGKKRGRPSKVEKFASWVLDQKMKEPKFKAAMEKAALDMALYGFAVVSKDVLGDGGQGE